MASLSSRLQGECDGLKDEWSWRCGREDLSVPSFFLTSLWNLKDSGSCTHQGEILFSFTAWAEKGYICRFPLQM